MKREYEKAFYIGFHREKKQLHLVLGELKKSVREEDNMASVPRDLRMALRAH